MKAPATALEPSQRDADAYIEGLWRARVELNIRRRNEEKRIRRPRLVEATFIPKFLRKR